MVLVGAFALGDRLKKVASPVKLSTILRSTAVLAIAAAPTIAAPAAQAAPPRMSPHIIGGQPATNPGVVQLSFQQKGGTYGCTGELISSEWVLTAQHCTDGDSSMKVYFSNSTSDRGAPIAADNMENSPYGDVALVHLSEPAPVSTYLKLADSYSPLSGDSGVVEGYGLRANKTPTTGLYKANVSVIGASTDAYKGNAIHIKGVSGASNHGDSGGPLIINDKIVGVCSTGDVADPGSDTLATSNYANLTDSRAWISDIASV